ncbi:MAG: OmpH family outer membrane protein [Bacteroidetes bacterium]|jgi:outer membrane protein|nr:OmpH family outer membrane protein [Bacteroidota bacterium]
MKRNIVFLVFALLFSVSMMGQKFGYMDSNELVAEMPEVKQADAKLETLQKQLQKQGQAKLQALQQKAQDLERKERQGEIAPKKLQEEAEKLQAEQLELQQFEQDMQRQVMQKRQELYKPIFDKINAVIEEIAKEQEYTYIFDLSAGSILYADESKDVTSLVRQRLGI